MLQIRLNLKGGPIGPPFKFYYFAAGYYTGCIPMLRK